MRKIHIIILSLIITVVAGFLFVACGAPRLASPSDLTIENKTLSWNAVDNARGYTVEIAGEQHDLRRTTFSFDNVFLEEGTYTFRVKARGNGVDFSDSDWATIDYVQGYENGLTYTLTELGHSYEVSSVGRAKGDVVIDDYYNGLPVTGIGRLAFTNSLDLTSVTFGKNIRSVGSRAFYGCSKLETVVLNDGLVDIGDTAFQTCRELTEIEIPNTVTTIGDNAFAFCRKLEAVNIGIGVTSIGKYAFNTCVSLNQIVLPTSVARLGANSFQSCSALKEVKIESLAMNCDASVFMNCESLVSVDFGNCEMAISDNMFSGCAALTDLVIPDSVLSIATGAFRNCSALKNISIGSGVTSIGQFAFFGTAAYTESVDKIIVVDNWAVGVKSNPSGVNDITDEDISLLRNKNIVGIAEFAFRDSANIITVVLPNSVKYIGRGAFYLCSGLMAIELGDETEMIGYGAFRSCRSLIAIDMGESLQVIESYAFADCENLQAESVTIPKTVVKIGTYAFYNTYSWKANIDNLGGPGILYVDDWVVACSTKKTGAVEVGSGIRGVADYAFAYCETLREVKLPDTVKIIGEGAFYGCLGKYMGDQTMFPAFTANIPYGVEKIEPYTYYRSALSGVIDIPNTVKIIGLAAFSGCTQLNSVTIPNEVVELGDYAFWGCTALRSVTLSNRITEIKNYTFSGCSALSEITIPNSVIRIGDYAFFRCENLQKADMGDGVISIGSKAFYMCISLNDLNVSPNLITIDSYAFYKCVSLENFDFSDRLNRIGDFSFYGCVKFDNISLPESLTYIGNSAFRYCSSLNSVALGKYLEYIGSYAFYGCRELTFYSETDSEPVGWQWRWNSLFRPVVYGCTFGNDSGAMYVASITLKENSIANYNAYGGISAPSRSGYTFAGWATSATSNEIIYSAEDIYKAPVDTVLYAVWTQEA